MKRLFLLQISGACAAVLFIAHGIAHAQKPTAVRERVEEALQAVAAGQPIPPDAEFVPLLIEIVDRGEHQQADLAIRALAQLKSAAAPAAAALCAKLADRSHNTRSLVVDALVAIGDDAATPLRAMLEANSSRARAAAKVALGRLKKISLEEMDPLAADPDPRVRVAVAGALAHMGRPGVKRLTPMLQDPDVAVAIKAAQALRLNRSDPGVAVPALAEGAGRSLLCSTAVPALSAYGINARNAVPQIINAYECIASGLVSQDDYAPDHVEEALRHTGPPDEDSVTQLIPLLTSDNTDVQIFTANVLCLMGTHGRAAAPAIEHAIEVNLDRYHQQIEAQDDNPDGDQNSSLMTFDALETFAAALWYVTEDARRFVNAVERIVVSTDEPMEFEGADPSDVLSFPSPWAKFATEDVPGIDRLLNSSNHNLKLTALDGVSDIGARAEPLLATLVGLAEGNHMEPDGMVFVAIGAIGPPAAKQLEPLLLSNWRDAKISLSGFSSVACQLKLRSDAVRTILKDGLWDPDHLRSRQCAEALCATSDRPEETAALIIAAARGGTLRHLDAVEPLTRLPEARNVILPYLVEQASNEDSWTRHYAIEALGAFGRPASGELNLLDASALKVLKRSLLDDPPGIRLEAAKSLYQISGVSGFLTKELHSAMSVGENRKTRKHDALQTIAELGPSGARFLGFVIDELHSTEPSYIDQIVEALLSVGSPDATAELKKLAESSDYERRTLARAALRKIQARSVKGER